MYQPQDINSNAILYSVNQPAKSNWQNRQALLIYLFGTNEFLDINTNNISTSLLRITNFIQSKNIKEKSKKDISTITSFD